MQIEKALINDHLRVSKVSLKSHILAIYNCAVIYQWSLLFSLKSSLLFNNFYFLFLVISKTLWLNKLKNGTAMNAKLSVFVICIEAIIYMLLYNFHDCTFKISIPHQKLNHVLLSVCYVTGLMWKAVPFIYFVNMYVLIQNK